MMKEERSVLVTQQPHAFLRLVPRSRPGPLAGAEVSPVLELPGLRLTRLALEAGGQAHAMKDIRGFRTRRQAPPLCVPLLLASICVALVVPVMLSAPGVVPVYAALLLVAGMVAGALLYTVTVRDTYGLILRTAQGDQEVFRSRDAEAFTRLVEALDRTLVWCAPEALPQPPARTLSR
ncbi:DUF6232 family protein [Stigmatella erecta]|uniref:Uncharacterized protein n=1 Tax=Stigmatella erecta TaxID=83460 RepID=A0A1I0KD51_9BACT|nr:DUF6232 family protein [Stigmatella erecta]SEU22054.1 hypothetical protein SAMN05443639_11085 [Stigmatella erecta]